MTAEILVVIDQQKAMEHSKWGLRNNLPLLDGEYASVTTTDAILGTP